MEQKTTTVKNPIVKIGDDIIENVVSVKLKNADSEIKDEYVEFFAVKVILNTEV